MRGESLRVRDCQPAAIIEPVILSNGNPAIFAQFPNGAVVDDKFETGRRRGNLVSATRNQQGQQRAEYI